MALRQLNAKYREFEKEFINEWDRYVQCHKNLDAYRGVMPTEANIPQINKIIGELQDSFHELYTSFQFVNKYGLQCAQAVKEYNEFMAEIKATGAEPIDETKKPEEAQA
jgi:hypothetical protein